jgi:hypothetical protein
MVLRCPGCGRVLTEMRADVPSSRSRAVTMPGPGCSKCEPTRGQVPDAYRVADELSRRELSRRVARP